MCRELFNKNELKKLKEAEPYLVSAVKSGYKLGTSNRLDNIVADCYEALTGKVVKRNFNCGKCVYNLYREVGEIYLKSISNGTEG